MSHLEDSHSLEMRGIANVSKKVRSSRISSERPQITSEVPNLESEEPHRSKNKNDRPLSLFKNKPLIQVDSDWAGNDVSIGASERPVALMDTLNVASTACSRAETEKCFNFSKGKRPEVEMGDTALCPANYSTLGEVPTQTNQTESMRSISGRIQSQSENDASTKVCLDLSLGRPLISEGSAEDNIYKTNPAFLQQQDRPGRYPHLQNKNFVGQLSVLKNPLPSLPVRKGLTWDLDGRIAHSTGITLEKQNYSALSEKRGFTLQEKVDGKGKNEEVQGHLEASMRQNDQKAYKAFEKGSSDDIPMEIVELMAKNQFERQLAGGEGRSLSKRTDCANRGSGKVHGSHQMKWLQTQIPGIMNIPHANATNGIAVTVDNRVATSGNAINFSNADERNFKLSQREGIQLKLFSTFQENQQKLSSGVQYPVSGSSITGSQPIATPVWLSKNKNIPFGLGIPQKFSTLSNTIEPHARSAEMQHKGRTISDIKSEEMKMQNESQLILSKPGGGELTIPAMQLLSLMDKGMASNAAFSEDANRFLEIPSFRCDYQPGFSTDARHIVDTSFPLQQHQGPGFYCAGESSSRPSSSFASQMSFRSQKFEESGKWASTVPLGISKSGKSFPRSGGMHISHRPCSRKDKQNRDKQKGVLGTSNSRKIPSQCRRLENSPRVIDLQANNVSGSSLPSKGTLEDEDCSFNQNPAEFSIPEPGNEYTISGGDLKILKKDFDRERSYSVNVDGRKRQRPTKVSTGKKHARHLAS